jgi:hypothetical protein
MLISRRGPKVPVSESGLRWKHCWCHCLVLGATNGTPLDAIWQLASTHQEKCVLVRGFWMEDELQQAVQVTAGTEGPSAL